MKIMYFVGLSDRLLKYFTDPIANINGISSIDAVRNIGIVGLKKVKFITPPTSFIIKIPFVKLFYKILKSLLAAKKNKPKLIIGFLLWPHGILALLVAKLIRVEVGLFLIAGPIEIYTHKSVLGKYAYTNELPKFNIKAKLIFYFVKQFDYIFVAGSYTKSFLIKNGYPEHRVHIIPYAITDNIFEQRKNVKKIFDIIHVGRVMKNKHIDIVIKVTKLLKEKYGMSNIRVSILGRGPELDNLKVLAVDLGVNENIVFHDYQEDITKYYNQAKLTIITSEREAGPYTFIESLLCGVPVVGSKCGDTINDNLVTGYNGILINDYRDVEEYSLKIYNLLNDEDTLSAYSRNCISIKEKIDINEISKQWSEILNG